jgi:YD repeat-containing protein
VLAVEGSVRTTSTYDPADQLTAAQTGTAVTNYSYDGAGNRVRQDVSGGALSLYAWDAWGRPVVVTPFSAAVSLAYDADGRRVGRSGGAGPAKIYLYDFHTLLREQQDDGSAVRQYASTAEVYGELLNAWSVADGGRYYEADALGSTELLLDASGSVAARYAYRAVGRSRSRLAMNHSLSRCASRLRRPPHRQRGCS